MLLSGPSLLTFYPGEVTTGIGDLLTNLFRGLVPLILAIVVLASTVEIVKDVVRILRPGTIEFPLEKGTK